LQHFRDSNAWEKMSTGPSACDYSVHIGLI
jgi:hypothetical protein